MPDYRPGRQVHWIQAKRGLQNPGSWRSGWVFDVGYGFLVAGFHRRERFLLACSYEVLPVRLLERLPLVDRLPVQLSLRWSLLCYRRRLVSVRGPLPPTSVSSELTAEDWQALDRWRSTAGSGCDSPIRPCWCRPDLPRRRPPGPLPP